MLVIASDVTDICSTLVASPRPTRAQVFTLQYHIIMATQQDLQELLRLQTARKVPIKDSMAQIKALQSVSLRRSVKPNVHSPWTRRHCLISSPVSSR